MTKTTSETIEFLRQYNQWRRGDDNIKQPDPKRIGIAIDHACNTIEKMSTALNRINRGNMTRTMIEDIIADALQP